MVLRVDVVVSAIERAEAAMGGQRMERILLSPAGERFTQKHAAAFAESPGLCFVCGRYEGFDDRVHAFVDRSVSLGDFVLSGGEVAAMAMIEASVRLLPGVLGNEASSREESFSSEWDGLLEYPQYTRPASFRGHDVPELLKSGDHELVRRWRREQALAKTAALRPDILGAPDERKRS
jgi:tRNA (guanine37-N1)-methyltransferase